MDPRREVRQIWKHLGRYQTVMGETVIYYVFDAENSEYDEVYDEANRKYHPGVQVPVMWIDQIEAPESAGPDGRLPTQRCRWSCSADALHGLGISVVEVHGNQLTDPRSSDVWTDGERLNDIFYYDNRYYEVSAFSVGGRFKGEDVVIGVAGIETFPGHDMLLDYKPQGVV